jgi:7-cyano-7-deazaguanine synthase in queuosine biosynthesis
MEIATYVFAADCAVRRGGPYLKNFAERWRRSFHLIIAVRRPEAWGEATLLAALTGVLGFLSEDEWRFEFVPLMDPPGLKGYLPGLRLADLEGKGETSIVMFSGGLDSFAGAVNELNTTNAHVLLMSRRIGGMTDSRQTELAQQLRKSYPNRVSHVPVLAGLTKETEAVEHSQRTRSFLLMAIGLVAAAIEESNRLRFYENGIMSVNLPISAQVVGTRASRSTHPRSLSLLQDLGALVSERPVQIGNPFAWLTKVEVVQTLNGRLERPLIARTLSCSSTRRLTTMKPHCGQCMQCLQRRIATVGAGAEDVDSGIDYETDLLLGARQGGDDTVMAVETVRSAFEHRRLTDEGFAIRYAGELASVADGTANAERRETVLRVANMYRRQADSIRQIIISATREHVEAFTDKALPARCLLRLVQENPEIGLDDAPMREPAVQASGPAERMDTLDRSQTGQLIIAVDAGRHQILMDGGLGPIKGATDFAIMRALTELDRANRERRPSNRPTISAEVLAESTTGGDVGTLRQAVARIRKSVRKDYRDLHDVDLHRDALIENVNRQGYRLNPQVMVVSADELRN